MRYRFSFKIAKRRFYFYFFTKKVQLCEGMLSTMKNDDHVIMWDLEGEELKLYQVQKELKRIQRTFDLGEIFITSDHTGSYQAWCFTLVNFKAFLEILLETRYVDWQFFKNVVRYGRACLRCGNKKGRKDLKVIDIIEGRKETIPHLGNFIYETYETGANG